MVGRMDRRGSGHYRRAGRLFGWLFVQADDRHKQGVMMVSV